MFAHSLWLLSAIALSEAAYIPLNSVHKSARAVNGTSSIVWDARILQNVTLKDFDSEANVFRPDFTKGTNVSFSDLIVFPGGSPSLFDKKVNAKSFEVTISDKSIFQPGSAQPQSAIRRAELMPPANVTASNITTRGVKTLHFSLMPDPQRPLNVSHEYLLTFLETSDFSGGQFTLKTGTSGGTDGSLKNDLVLTGNSKNSSKTLFTTLFTPGAFTNFALKMDFDKNTLQVFQSTGDQALVQRTEALPNDMSGDGAYHFGLFKQPTDPGADSLRSGFQESGINEGIIYGSVFIEDSSNGLITLS